MIKLLVKSLGRSLEAFLKELQVDFLKGPQEIFLKESLKAFLQQFQQKFLKNTIRHCSRNSCQDFSRISFSRTHLGVFLGIHVKIPATIQRICSRNCAPQTTSKTSWMIPPKTSEKILAFVQEFLGNPDKNPGRFSPDMSG